MIAATDNYISVWVTKTKNTAFSHNKTFFITSLGNKIYCLLLDVLAIFGKLARGVESKKGYEEHCFPWCSCLEKWKSCHLLKGWPWILTTVHISQVTSPEMKAKNLPCMETSTFKMKIFLWLNDRKRIWDLLYINLLYVSRELPNVFQDMIHPPAFLVCITLWVPIHAVASLLWKLCCQSAAFAYFWQFSTFLLPRIAFQNMFR